MSSGTEKKSVRLIGNSKSSANIVLLARRRRIFRSFCIPEMTEKRFGNGALLIPDISMALPKLQFYFDVERKLLNLNLLM